MNPAIKTLLRESEKLRAREKKLLEQLEPVRNQLDGIVLALDAMGYKATDTAGAASPEQPAAPDIVQPAFTGVKS